MPRGVFKRPAPEARFWAKVEAADCWDYTGRVNDQGYGIFLTTKGAAPVRAHRYAYQLLVGPVPAGKVLDHLCRNRRCVNPDHLEPVTIRENVLRGATVPARNLAKTHCPRGHEYSPENTRRGRDGSRHCRACNRLRQRARKDKAE